MNFRLIKILINCKNIESIVIGPYHYHIILSHTH